MVKKITGMEWLKKQIKKLEITNSEFKEKTQQIIKIDPNVYNEFQAWTPLKLILLNYVLDVCTTIIKTKSFFKKLYYIDLFAGSGINKIKETTDFFIGSPLIAAFNHADYYNEMLFCEKNDLFSETLDLRLQTLNKKNLFVKKGIYENYLNEILEKVKSAKTYSFFFIDPNCMEFTWDNMKKVLSTKSDIIFNFMSSEINRAVGYAKKRKGGNSLTKLFGDTSWKKASNHEDLVEIYKNNILKERMDAPIRIIKVRSKKFHFCYHLLFITNKTKGGNSWLRAIEKAKKEIEKNSDKAVEIALDIVKKRQSELSQF